MVEADTTATFPQYLAYPGLQLSHPLTAPVTLRYAQQGLQQSLQSLQQQQPQLRYIPAQAPQPPQPLPLPLQKRHPEEADVINDIDMVSPRR